MIRIAETKFGTLEGTVSNGGFALFRGIRYAAPPIGQLRWKPPAPPESWEGVKVCDTFGPICPQKDRSLMDETGHPIVLVKNYPYPPRIDEDCLFMNIYTPAKDSGDRLPVMIYFHGGGVQEHFGSDYEYCGDGFCRHGVILVSINYRLNVFGYFVHPELAAESEHDASGNYGLMDQIAAIRYVKENIAAFGGDPDNITVFGQSGGGRSVQAICSSPLSKGLYQHASIHSAGGLCTVFAGRTREQMEAHGIAFMKRCGCQSVAQMRALPWQTILAHNLQMVAEGGFQSTFNIYPDGYVLPVSIEDAILEGMDHDVDYIMGCTIDEGHDGSSGFRGMNMCASIRGWAGMRLKNRKSPVYVYCFDRPQPGGNIGTPHSCDVRYLFGTIDGTWRPYVREDYELSEKMLTYWSNFAKTGNPNCEALPYWKPYLEDELELRLSIDGCEMVDYDQKGQLKALERRYIVQLLESREHQ